MVLLSTDGGLAVSLVNDGFTSSVFGMETGWTWSFS